MALLVLEVFDCFVVLGYLLLLIDEALFLLPVAYGLSINKVVIWLPRASIERIAFPLDLE